MGLITYAEKLAIRVKNVLRRQVQEKGYEVDAILFQKEGDADKLSISNTGMDSKVIFSIPVKIIVTSHDIELFPMELGDNPDNTLDFIWIENENIQPEQKVNEGMMLRYLDNEYTITIASPTGLGNNLVIKECQAKKVR